jgi:hypothetical protein
MVLINFTNARSSIIILIKFASRIIVKENNGYLLVTFIGNRNHKMTTKNLIFLKFMVTTIFSSKHYGYKKRKLLMFKIWII